MIVQCLTQLSVKLGEAQRTLSHIDPYSIASTTQTDRIVSCAVADRILPVSSPDQGQKTNQKQRKASSRLSLSSATLKRKKQAPDEETNRLP